MVPSLSLKTVSEWRADIYAAFAATGTLRRYPRKSAIFNQGEDAAAAYAVQSGMVELTGVSEAGREVGYSIRRPGDSFGFAELVLREKRTRNALALDDCEIWVVPKADFLDILATRPDVVLALLGSALERGNRQAELRISFRGSSARHRVAAILSYLATKPGGLPQPHEPVTVKITHESVSRLCELSRQTVTTALDEFEQEGLVSLGFGTLVVRDWHSLRAIADSAD